MEKRGNNLINLEMRAYNRAELEEIFHSTRTDTFRKTLARAGYTFETAGRGKGYTITITGLPEPPTPFEIFAKREFKCGPQTNYKGMETHFFLLFYDPEYQFLPSNHQAKYLKDNYNITISDATLRNWQNKLIDKNWIAKDKDKVKYVLCRKGEPPREITEEEYKRLWHKYFAHIAEGFDRGTALHIIYEQNHGMPRRQVGLTENALTQDKLQELRQILEKSH